jgi:hypothetical protein
MNTGISGVDCIGPPGRYSEETLALRHGSNSLYRVVSFGFGMIEVVEMM